MTKAITMDIINDPQAFINEVVRNHGTDSIQYSWAKTVVSEVQAHINKANK